MRLRLLLDIGAALGLIDNILLGIAKPLVRSGRVALNKRHEHAIVMGEG